jgi:hypothetical protein
VYVVLLTTPPPLFLSFSLPSLKSRIPVVILCTTWEKTHSQASRHDHVWKSKYWHFKDQWLLCIPPAVTFTNSAFFTSSVLNAT